MPELTIVAMIKVDPSRVEDLKPLFADMIRDTLVEAGCIQYDLHHDNQDPALFMFYETWESRALWQDHMAAPHLKRFQEASSGMVTSVEVFEMSKTF